MYSASDIVSEEAYSMESDLGKALANVSTSRGWSILKSLINKVNQRLVKNGNSKIKPEELCDFVQSIPDDVLIHYGIWKHGFRTGKRVANTALFSLYFSCYSSHVTTNN